MKTTVIQFNTLTMKDVLQVGGKNASLGEMISQLSKYGIRVPEGFAITVDAFNEFIEKNQLHDRIKKQLEKLDHETLDNLSEIGAKCRELVRNGIMPGNLKKDIENAYEELNLKYGREISVAVRSSATAEDSPTASFAGQHDSFLNIFGIDNLIQAVQDCYISLYNDRAIKYRIDNKIPHDQVKQSVGVQLMVRSDKSSAGVAFTIEPENGNQNLIYITGAWGLGESVVQGAVNTDEFYLFKKALDEDSLKPIVSKKLGSKEKALIYGEEGGKSTKWININTNLRDQFVLDDEEIKLLGQWCYQIEKHYKLPMDIEWAKDGVTGKLFIVQARPETVHGKSNKMILKEYTLKTDKNPVLTGKAVGHSIVSGRVSVVKSLKDAHKVKKGDIIVADITNPDWNALLKKAICIITNQGGRTSHASIVARELGIPAVVGTLKATEILKEDNIVTVSCATGDMGLVFEGKLDWEETQTELENLSDTHTKPMFILANPESALMYASYPNEGVGLLRMEFIINNSIQIHPMALVKYDELPDNAEKKQIQALTRHYIDKKRFFVDQLAESIGMVAAAFYPKDVIVRMSDFKSNEYAALIGGRLFEPEEENPMLGFRGASRYYNSRYKEGFGLECEAIKMVREEMNLTNVKIMIPFCRTVEEGRNVLEVIRNFGLGRGVNGLEVYVMAEIPSNIILASQFAELFDGFSIGSNDLTQLALGLDRDSAIVSDLFDENNEAVKTLIRDLIRKAHEAGVKVGLCGQAPSDHEEFAQFLVENGIDTISFNPDAMVRGIKNIVAAEELVSISKMPI
jgi:pyruvate, water dikinase